MDYRIAQELQQTLRGNTTYILVKLAPGADAAAVQAELRRRLPYNDVYTKDEWALASRNYWVSPTGLGLNMYLTVFLGCLVGIVVVAQTLYTSTMEHIKEFGTVKAIGGSNLDIYRILGEQALIAAVPGLRARRASSRYLVRPLMATIHLNLLISPGFSAVVFAGTVLMCLGAALFCFRHVASIDPALVFRT